MNLDAVLNVAGLIVGVAAITAVVQSPNTKGVISAIGNLFSDAIRASLGN